MPHAEIGTAHSRRDAALETMMMLEIEQIVDRGYVVVIDGESLYPTLWGTVDGAREHAGRVAEEEGLLPKRPSPSILAERMPAFLEALEAYRSRLAEIAGDEAQPKLLRELAEERHRAVTPTVTARVRVDGLALDIVTMPGHRTAIEAAYLEAYKAKLVLLAQASVHDVRVRAATGIQEDQVQVTSGGMEGLEDALQQELPYVAEHASQQMTWPESSRCATCGYDVRPGHAEDHDTTQHSEEA